MSRKKDNFSKLNLGKIGGRIEYLRKNKGLTQLQLSEKINISKGSISQLENHKYDPSANTIIMLSELFEVTTDWILFGERIKKEDQEANFKRLECQNIITRFKDQIKALENNEHLITIEDTSPKLYKKVSEYLETNRIALETITEEKKEIENPLKKKEKI